jgi:hypothetical protein
LRNRGTFDKDGKQIGQWFYHREDGTVQDVVNFEGESELIQKEEEVV